MGRAVALAGIAALLGIAALPLGIGGRLEQAFARSVQTFSGSEDAQKEITLDHMDVYALQLGVFDSIDRASAEVQRLEAMGVSCMIWQKERLRLIADVALTRDALDYSAAKGQDAYVISQALDEVLLRIGAQADAVDAACALVALPDETLLALLDGSKSSDLIPGIRTAADAARQAHPGHALYTTLADNLLAWCDMMERPAYAGASGYGRAAMFALCRELRQALIAASTASAQRTPSTAADVIPPA